jgi:hypothetical protein
MSWSVLSRLRIGRSKNTLRGSGPSSIQFNRHRGSLRRGKADGVSSWPLTSIYCRLQEEVEIHLHSTNMPSWRAKNYFIHSALCIRRNLHDLRNRQIEVNETSIPEQVPILCQKKKKVFEKIDVDWSFTFSSGYTQSIRIEIKFHPGF